MPRLRPFSGPVADLRQYRQTLATLMPGVVGLAHATPTTLVETSDFGTNPGNLRMLAHVPADLPSGAPLVVALHGCTQTAEGYDRGAGWSALADRAGFAVLLPEQRRANNANTCFNWFQPEDVTRDQGEALSIRQMVARMVDAHGLDPNRIFITGLSAGGAMTASMLATYPDIFAGGAIIAGLPHGCATGLHEALDRMRHGRPAPAAEWGALVRAASPHHGPWPAVQIWHGTADPVVVPANAQELVEQWTDIHGLPPVPTAQDHIGPHSRLAWTDRRGRVVVEYYVIAGMGHGVPLLPATPDDPESCGEAGAFMLPAGISSTYRIAASWGLVPAARRPHAATPPKRTGPGGAIAAMLRKAGLLRGE